jgi:FkbM family methyltransferase
LKARLSRLRAKAARPFVRFKPRTTRTVRNLRRIGTEYGGWTFLDRPELRGSTVVCAGVGEDISFDIGFAREYDGTVIIVDPTPRAVLHVMRRLRDRVPRTAELGDTGKQDVGTYDLTGLREDQISLDRRALWETNGTLEFFVPQNPAYVSHSVVNLHGTNEFIEVDAVTLGGVLETHGITTLPLLKLDIEGAEIEVIDQMLGEAVRPHQILVEFDELNAPSLAGKKRVRRCYKRLIAAGYDLVYFNGSADCLFVRKGLPSG